MASAALRIALNAVVAIVVVAVPATPTTTSTSAACLLYVLQPDDGVAGDVLQGEGDGVAGRAPAATTKAANRRSCLVHDRGNAGTFTSITQPLFLDIGNS